MPVSTIRTRMRQEFEKNRFVNKIAVVDVLLMKNNAEYQVRPSGTPGIEPPFAGPQRRPARNNGANLIRTAGDDELLEADYARHVLFQGGELPRGQEATLQLHGGVPGGKLPGVRSGHQVYVIANAIRLQGRN